MPRRIPHGRPAPTVVVALAVAVAVLAVACSSTEQATTGAGASTSRGGAPLAGVVSTRADMVSGGDVLLAVDGTDGSAGGGEPRVTVDGKAAAATVTSRPDGSSNVLVKGLPDGRSTIGVTAGGRTGRVVVTNHPISGPVFSGKQLPMTICTTDRFGLAPSTPPDCDADPVVRLAWVDGNGRQHFVSEATQVPPEAAKVTVGGVQRPALLRVESGVIDRGVYTITTLAGASSPTAGTTPAGPWDSSHWNGRLVYRFGGGCGTTFGQGFQMVGTPSLDLLADGYAFATNTLDTFQVQCQDIVSAEAAMMTKEHFAEAYGVPEVTIGEGGSGGAIQQLLIAQDYPGILDAIAPVLVFPDAASIAPGVVDCALLANFYASPDGASFTADQRSAVNGHLTPLTCSMWEQTFVPVIDPTKCGFGDAVGGAVTVLPGLEQGYPTVPADQVYDPVKNPKGIRCTFQDSYPQVFGTDPATGFARRPVDNVGVQYGLKALDAGVISFDQFVALNQHIGGLDIDAKPVAERMVAPTDALERLYRTGRVVEGGPLRDIPVIAMNVYTDDQGDIHDRFRMFSLDARLRDAQGHQAPGYVMWTRPPGPGGDLVKQLTGALDVGADITRLLDTWATALKSDRSDRPVQEKLAAARPAEAVNTCFDAQGGVVASGADVYDGPGPCTDPYPVRDDPRTAAGAPLRNDIAKCRLQSVADAAKAGVYEPKLTGDQVSRLEQVFPDGVCDWTRKGVGQVRLGKPWQTFGSG